MGDFPTPAVATNGSSICLNNNLSSSLGGAGIGVNSAPHGPPPGHNATHSGGGTNGSGGIPKHSTVVERLRQRIEGCRRHHVSCENRYQQAQAEQLELERRDTVSLYQRTLEQRAKKSSSGGGSKQPHSSKQPQDAEPATAEQRNHTLIMVRGRARGLGAAAEPLWAGALSFRSRFSPERMWEFGRGASKGCLAETGEWAGRGNFGPITNKGIQEAKRTI